MRMSVKQQEIEQNSSRCHYCGSELTGPGSTYVVAVFPQEIDKSPYTIKVCESCSDRHWELQMKAEFGS